MSVNSCPYCHAYEVRDEPLAVLSSGDMSFHYAMMIAHWSRDLVELTRFGGQFHVRPPERGLSTSFQSSLVNNSRAPNGVAACCRTLR